MAEQSARRKTSNGYSNDLESWLIVLPYLNPTELASISATCRNLFQISRSVTCRRTSDASRGFENIPIPFLVADLHSPHYPYFLYTPTHTFRVRHDFRQPWGSDNDARLQGPLDPFLLRIEGATGCGCSTECTDHCCPCLECGPSCECDSAGCGNRRTQGGVSLRLEIVKDKRKGWGLYAAEFIRTARFVCEYADNLILPPAIEGEVLSTKETRERQETYDKLASTGHLTPALLVVKEHLPSRNAYMRINIDATRIGNIARFINHSCDGGNLDTVIVRSSGALLPRVCFFASRDIQKNEELSFSYGDVRLKPDGQPCFCGTSSCAGTLPSEHT